MSSSSPHTPQPLSLSEFELDMLKQEYFFLQTTIEDYNKQIWVIKALGITGTGAVIALVLQQQQEFIALIGCVIPLFFWILESQWKHFQRGFYPRVAAIEDILRNQCQLRSPAIFCGWSQA
jgi:purine-cytosine permease-like protein